MIHGFLLRAYNIEKLSKNGYKYDDSGEVNQLLRHSRLMHSDKLSAGGSSQFFVAGLLRRLLNYINFLFFCNKSGLRLAKHSKVLIVT